MSSEFRDKILNRVNDAMESVIGDRFWTSEECHILVVIVDDIIENNSDYIRD